MRASPARIGLLACVLLSVAVGCSRRAGDSAERWALDETAERGPLSVRAQASRKKLSLADTLRVRFSATAPEAYRIDFPRAGAKLAAFAIKNVRSEPPRLSPDGKVTVARTYTVEPFLSGEYAVPPIEVKFVEKGAKDAKPKTHTLRTKELKVEVTSLGAEKAKSLRLRGARGTVDPPRSRAWVWWTLAGVAVAAAAALTARALRRRRKARTARAVPAHEIAYAELRALIESGLIEKGEIKIFYDELSDILRRYVENRFGYHAPERTTEEFLREIHDEGELGAKEGGALKAFLTHCDLVKFAEHEPGEQEIQDAFDAATAFIARTRSDDALTPVEREEGP